MASSVIKNPPILADLDNYEQWKEDVLMWKEITDLEPNKQALAVHLTLKGQAKEIANQLETKEKKKGDGLDRLLKKLDEAFLKEPERRKFMAYQNFEECVRRDGISICDFMREFDTKYFKMKAKGMELPDEVLAFRLVKNSRLTEIQRDQVMASTKPLSFKEVRATLKRMFESDKVAGSEKETVQGVRVKEEPVYVAQSSNKVEGQDKIAGSKESLTDDKEEDVMWATNYGNRSRYRPNGNWNGRYTRNRYGRYSKGNWGNRANYDIGCFECGSKDHWARNCDKRERDNKGRDL